MTYAPHMPLETFANIAVRFYSLGITGLDQLKTFSVVAVCGGSCWNPPFRPRNPVGQLDANYRVFGALLSHLCAPQGN